MSLLGSRRFKCVMDLLRGRGCDLLNVDLKKLLTGSEEEKEKIYKFLPELDMIRKSGYDIVGRLVELVNRLQSEKMGDIATALAIAVNVMFGGQISEEDAKMIGEAVQMIECVQFDQGWVEVDSQCLDKFDVPQELKDKFKTLAVVNLVWT